MTLATFTIDTLEFSKDLEKSGMPRKTAETLAEKIKEVQIASSQELATKSDILLVKQDLENFRQDLKQEIKISMLTTIISLGGIIALVEKFVR
ncbi:MAG: hypothetical protein KA100_06955 [Rickettsiales bacterium]|nr:hypothetical protein [Rickettsiales bacterium]